MNDIMVHYKDWIKMKLERNMVLNKFTFGDVHMMSLLLKGKV
jgi:hypothetical protein